VLLVDAQHKHADSTLVLFHRMRRERPRQPQAMIVLFLFLVAVCLKKAEAGSSFVSNQIEVLLLGKKVIKASLSLFI
jgi:hypothetical protein